MGLYAWYMLVPCWWDRFGGMLLVVAAAAAVGLRMGYEDAEAGM